MKKGLLFISALSLLSVFGCVDEVHQPEDAKEVKVSVSLASVLTRTYLGDLKDNVRQVYWSPGDAVSLNGYVSRALTEEQAGDPSAEFKFYGGSMPYSVIYPASICGEFVGGEVTVNVPATQEYSPTSFGKGAAILYGYSEIEGAPVVLNNLCGAVKVTLSSQEGTTITIKRARLISNARTAPIAGEFVIDTKTGEYTVSEGIRTVTLDVQEADIAPSGEQSFYFTIPHGDYPEGFTLKFYDKDDDYPMECLWLRDKAVARTEGGSESAGVIIQAGKLYEFKPVEFVRGKKEILSGEEWKQFAQMVNDTGNETWKDTYLNATKTVNLGADIKIPKGTPQISSFPYVLEGNDFCITNDNATAPLIKTLPSGGVIRNLTMAGEMKTPDATKSFVEVAAFVHTISGGKIEDCVNEMVFNVDSKRVIFGSFARTFSAGEINRCVNNADMNITMDLASQKSDDLTKADFKSFGGGIVATCFEPTTGCPVLNDCVNNGDLNITVNTAALGLARAGFAGVLGYISLKADTKYEEYYPILKNCTNNGDVTFSYVDNSANSKIQCSVGGIVGLSAALISTKSTSPASDVKNGAISSSVNHYHVEIENCTNTGRINNNATSAVSAAEFNSKIYTGGIAGALLGSSTNHAKIKNCTNTGEVVPYSVKVNPYSRASICGVSGGILGLGGYVDIEGGVMNAKVGSAQTRSFATAGVIGLAVYKFSIKDMSVNANISMIQAKDVKHDFTNPDYHALAVTNGSVVTNTDLSGSEISGCQFAGSFLISCSGTYDSAPVIPTETEITYVTADDFPAGTNVVSKSYTKGDITMSNNTYWSNVNAQ